MIQIAIAGATGRMGRCVLQRALRDPAFQVSAALVHPEDAQVGATVRVDDVDVPLADKLGTSCDVLIEFTDATGTMAWLDVCRRLELPMVIGATGHDASQLRRIGEAAEGIAIVKSMNFSAGASLLVRLAAEAAQALGEVFDIEVTEAHHRHKVDAPSGTAVALVEALRAARGGASPLEVTHSREGKTGPRVPGQIGVHSLRMGELAGWHEVYFSSGGETLTLRHVAESREPFAAGALRAAQWVVGQPPGLYSMADVLS